MKTNAFLSIAREAYGIADSKKAVSPLLLNVRKLTTLADYFLIVTGESIPQINAITEAIYKGLRDSRGIMPAHRDGRDSANWSVIDYGGLVVHVMHPAARKIYALEKIWDGALKVKPLKKKRR